MAVRHKVLKLVLTALLIGSCTLPMAAAAVSIGFSPMVLQLSGNPGSRQSFAISVNGGSDIKPTKVKASVVPIKQDDGGRYTVDRQGENPYSAVSWITLENKEIEIMLGQSGYIRGEVTIPLRYSGGGYAGILLEPITDEDESASGNVGVKIRTGFLVIAEIEVTGTAKRHLHISEVHIASATQPGMEPIAAKYGKNALLLSAVLGNDGNVHALATGSLIIRDAVGRKVKEIPLGGGRGLILPGAHVTLSSLIVGGLPVGDYSMQVMVNYGVTKPAVAKHTFSIGDVGLSSGQVSRGVRFLVEPEQLDLAMRLGSFRTQVVRLQNLEDKPIVIDISAEQLGFNLSGELDPEFGTAEHSALDWLRIQPERIELQPGARRNVQVMVQVPRGVSGGHYALLKFSAALAGQENADVTEEYCPIFLTPENPDIPQFVVNRVNAVVIPEEVSINITAEVENRGTIHANPQLRWRMSRLVVPTVSPGVQYIGDVEKVLAAEGSMGTLPGPMLPLEKREMTITIPEPATPGEYQIDIGLASGQTLNIVKSTIITIK